jgi:DNA-binding IscR family transcriptional regulator
VLRVADHRVTDSSCGQCDSERGYVCADSDGCGLKQVWSDVQLAVEKILFGTTFADVCARSQGASLSRSHSRVYELQA